MHMILELREDIQRVQGAAAPTPAATPPSSRFNAAADVPQIRQKLQEIFMDPSSGGYYLNHAATYQVAAALLRYSCPEDARRADPGMLKDSSRRVEFNRRIKREVLQKFREFTTPDGRKLFVDGVVNPEVATGMLENASYRQLGDQPYGQDMFRAYLVNTRGPYKPLTNAPSTVINYLPATHVAYAECGLEAYLANPSAGKMDIDKDVYCLRVQDALGRQSTQVTLPPYTPPTPPPAVFTGSQPTPATQWAACR